MILRLEHGPFLFLLFGLLLTLFCRIEVIEIIEGSGNSLEEINYLTYDMNPPKGIVYYRIRQTDFDGNNEYFSIKTVFVGENDPISWISIDNNGKPIIQLQGNLETKYTIKLYDIHGSVIFNHKFVIADQNASRINCDLPKNLNKGIYLIDIGSENFSSSGKIIIK